MTLELALHLAQDLDLGQVRTHARDLVGVDQVVLENREALGVLDPVVLAVLFDEESVHLCGGELVGVAAVDRDHDGVARLDEDLPPLRTFGGADDMARQDLLGHGHGTPLRGD